MKRYIRILGLCLVFLSALGMKAQNAFYIPSTELEAGSRGVLQIHLKNAAAVTAFQLDVTLPQGVTVNSVNRGSGNVVPDIQLTARKKSQHQLSCVKKEDGSYRLVALSLSNQSFADHDGCLLSLSVSVSPQSVSGSYKVMLDNIHIVAMKDSVHAFRIDQPDYSAPLRVTNASDQLNTHTELLVSTHALQAEKGSQTLSVALNNALDITALQFDMQLPQGITVNSTSHGDGAIDMEAQLTERQTSSHALSCRQLDNGTYRVVIVSMQNQPIAGQEGDLVNFDVNVPHISDGEYEVKLSQIHLVPLLHGQPGLRIDLTDETQVVRIENLGEDQIPQGDNVMRFRPLTLCPGGTEELCLEMLNSADICSFQFNMRLPEGISVVKEHNLDNEYTESFLLSDRKHTSHALTFKEIAAGTYFLLAYSLQNSIFQEHEGELVKVKVKADENMKDGDYGVSLSNVLMVTPEEQKITQTDYHGILTISSVPSGVEPTDKEDLPCVQMEGSSLRVKGLREGDDIRVYAVDGRTVAQKTAGNAVEWIPIKQRGVVLVEVSRGGRPMGIFKLVL